MSSNAMWVALAALLALGIVVEMGLDVLLTVATSPTWDGDVEPVCSVHGDFESQDDLDQCLSACRSRVAVLACSVTTGAQRATAACCDGRVTCTTTPEVGDD